MIEVTLTEETREYKLRVGAKLVGRVTVSECAYIEAETFRKGEWHPVYDEFSTLGQAARAVLRKAGYGRAHGVEVRKIRGVRS